MFIRSCGHSQVHLKGIRRGGAGIDTADPLPLQEDQADQCNSQYDAHGDGRWGEVCELDPSCQRHVDKEQRDAWVPRKIQKLFAVPNSLDAVAMI
jgi:hypothetical protein